MSELLAEKLAAVSLDDKTQANHDGKVDITDAFFQTAAQIPYSTIVKCNNFSLLHGTHALEAMNPKLDTLSLPIVKYNIEQELHLNSATGIVQGLLKCLTGWMTENISISNSILSCEYISRILETYTATLSLDDLCVRVNSCKSPYNLIVWKFSILSISTVKFIFELALKSQMYEDEDLNIDEMNLNWLFQLSKNEIFKLTFVPPSIWKQLENETTGEDLIKLQFLKNSFQLLYTITSLDSILQWKVPIFNCAGTPQFDKSVETKCKQLINIPLLNMITMEEVSPPDGCFNSNAQRTFDNQAPPKQLRIFELSCKECLNRFSAFFQDMIKIIGIVHVKTTVELAHYTRILSQESRSDVKIIDGGMNVLARILFSLFVCKNYHDEKGNLFSNVFGIENFSFKRLFYFYIRELVIMNSKLDKEISNASPSTKDNLESLQQIDYILANLSLLWKETLLLPALNPPRQRQLKCKEMKYWNMRQGEIAQTEEHFKKIKFYKSNDDQNYPLTMTIILFKLQSITDAIVRSVHVNLFKDVREYISAFYQLTMATHHLDSHLKKLEIMVKRNGVSLYTVQYLQFSKEQNRILHCLAKLMAKYYELLTCFGFGTLPKTLFKYKGLNEEALFNLQWKQFNVLSDPELLSFKNFKEQVTKMKEEFSTNEEKYKNDLQTEIANGEVMITEANAKCNKLMKDMVWHSTLVTSSQEHLTHLLKQYGNAKLEIEKLIECPVSPKSVWIHIPESHASFPTATFTTKKKDL